MSKLASALVFLQSTIDWEKHGNSVQVTLTPSSVEYITKVGHGLDLVGQHKNPIEKLLEFVAAEICSDCLQIDYLYRDVFFVSLVKAYIEYLFTIYGTRVSISKEMAHAFIKYDVTNYDIFCVCLDDEVKLNKDNLEDYTSDKCIYLLVSQ